MRGRHEIGLAIGSGAVRGFSAIPLIKRIQAEGIDICAVSGSSIGSILASYLALKGELDTLFEEVRDISRRRWLRMVDPNRPRRSMIKGKRIRRFLSDLYLEDRTFSDTRIPLIICGTDYCRKSPAYFTEGRLLDAVMASISIPGIFPPYSIKDTLFLDGGVLDPVPTQPLLDLGIKKAVGINLMGFPGEIPPDRRDIFSTLMATFYMMMERAAVRENTENLFMFNLGFQPDPMNILSFWKCRDYYEMGMEFTAQKFDAFLEWLGRPKLPEGEASSTEA